MRVWSLLAALLVAFGAAGPVRAERRPVAVVDLAFTPDAEKLAKDLERELNAHPDLSQLPDSTLSAELIGPPTDDDARHIADAQSSLGRARDHVGKYEFQLANVTASEGVTALLDVTPSLAVPTLADLAFVLGRVRLGEQKADEAREEFALSERLAPGRVLDPAQFLPEEIAAVQAAAIAPAGTATVKVKGTGTVWIDGTAVGDAGVPVEVVPGMHVVWLTGDDRETRGRLVRTAAGTATAVEIEDAPASDRLRVRRARLALAAAPDAVAMSGALAQLATLLGVHDAVLVSQLDGRIAVQTWRDRAPGFSPRHAADQPAKDLLLPLAPVHPKAVKPPEIIVPPPPPHVPEWWEKRWVQASIAGGIAIAVTSIILIGSYEGDRSYRPDASFPMGRQ